MSLLESPPNPAAANERFEKPIREARTIAINFPKSRFDFMKSGFEDGTKVSHLYESSFTALTIENRR